MTARANHVKMVLHVSMNLMVMYANADQVLSDYNVKVIIDKLNAYSVHVHKLTKKNYIIPAEIDECLSDPCNPIGTEECIDFDNKFICKCRTGYSGELCEGNYPLKNINLKIKYIKLYSDN